MLPRIIAIVVVLALLAGTFLFGRGGSERDQPAALLATAADNGYIARDAEVIETGADGRPRYRLEADRVIEQPRDRTVSLEHVTMHYRTELGAEWRLQANHGELPEDARNVELDGAVRVQGPMGPAGKAARTGGELELTTERLNVDTLEQVANTSLPVTLLWSGERIEGTGLWANLKEQRLRLESNVHGVFQPR
jgi:LPS export ABC transporter protein LptC